MVQSVLFDYFSFIKKFVSAYNVKIEIPKWTFQIFKQHLLLKKRKKN